MSKFLWGVLFFWGVTPAFGLIFYWNPIIGTGFHAIIQTILSIIIVSYGVNHPKRVIISLSLSLFMLIYSVYFLSTLFFLNPVVALSILAKYIIYVLPALAIMFIPSLLTVEKRIQIFCSALTASGIVLVAFLIIAGPSTDGRYGDLEVFHPNVVSYYLGISFIVVFYNDYYKSLAKKFLCITMGLFLVLMLSKTTLVSLFLAFSVSYFLFSEGAKEKLKVIFMASLMVAFLGATLAYLYWDYFYTYFNVGDGKLLYTLTGRTIIWQKLLEGEYISYFGHGGGVFDIFGPQPFENTIFSAHNGILNQFFSLGLFGVFAWFFYYFIAYKLSKKIVPFKNGMIFITVFFYALIRSLVESPEIGFNYAVVILSLISVSKVRVGESCRD